MTAALSIMAIASAGLAWWRPSFWAFAGAFTLNVMATYATWGTFE